LITDPDLRLNITEIREHAWFSLIKEEIQPGILIGYDHIIVDLKILKKLEQYGYNLDYSKKCLEANKHNNVTTAYYLLLKKYIQEGGISVADYGYKPEPLIVSKQHVSEIIAPIMPIRNKALKVNNRTGSMTSTNKESGMEFGVGKDIRSHRNASERVPKHRKISDSPQSRAKNELSFGIRLLFKKAATPRPPSLQKNGLKHRGKTPGIKGIELAPLAKFSPKPAQEGRIKFKAYL